MALKVKIQIQDNKLTGQQIASPRLVDLQTIEFDDFCELCTGSTVEKADVVAVMTKVMETLPKLVALGNKVVISPDGITVRPTISGSLVEADLRAALAEKKKEDPTVDVNRPMETSDLRTDMLTPGLAIDFSKKFKGLFSQNATLKRVSTGKTDEQSNDKGDANTNPDNQGGGNSGVLE